LLVGLDAGAPRISLPRFDIDWIRRFLGNLTCGHFASPERADACASITEMQRVHEQFYPVVGFRCVELKKTKS
jgi:hypothetical protein